MANVDDMSKHYDKHRDYHHESMKYWRSWGSWFSWGSPVGLGLFFIALAFSTWLLGLTFNWK